MSEFDDMTDGQLTELVDTRAQGLTDREMAFVADLVRSRRQSVSAGTRPVSLTKKQRSWLVAIAKEKVR